MSQSKSLKEKELLKVFTERALEEMESLFERVPYAREFHQGKVCDENYYRRHLLETILRIHLNNEVDAYCLYKINNSDDVLSVKLSTYLAEEYGHDHMFLKDLKKFGMTEKQVNDSEPFFSTETLIGYLYQAINKDGGMPTMIWNWFVEWYSDTYNPIISNKVAEVFGDEFVKGSRTHLQVDENEDHVALMFSTVMRTVKTEEDFAKASEYLKRFVWLIGCYFQELYDETLGQKTQKAA